MNLLKNTNKVSVLLNWVLVRANNKAENQAKKEQTKPKKYKKKIQSPVMSEEIEKVALNNIKWIQIIARFEWAKRRVSVWQREREIEWEGKRNNKHAQPGK